MTGGDGNFAMVDGWAPPSVHGLRPNLSSTPKPEFTLLVHLIATLTVNLSLRLRLRLSLRLSLSLRLRLSPSLSRRLTRWKCGKSDRLGTSTGVAAKRGKTAAGKKADKRASTLDCEP